MDFDKAWCEHHELHVNIFDFLPLIIPAISIVFRGFFPREKSGRVVK
jgi:hypothetical protein